MKFLEYLKWLAYRAPILNKINAPHYPYKINPGQLSFLIEAIDNTRNQTNPGCILEVGVARGMTSFFLAKHLSSTGDTRKLVLLDTFSGFDSASMDFEIHKRGKSKEELNAFNYHSKSIFERQIRNIPYKNVEIIQCDATQFNYSSISPIDAALIDVDLYLATKVAAQAIWPHLSPGASILIDDCIPESPWDGSLQAYQELCAEWSMSPRWVGGKGGILQKPNQDYHSA